MADPVQSRMTWSEYQQLPEDGYRYEVLDGQLMMSPAPGRRHQQVSMNLSFLIETWRRQTAPAGVLLAAPFDVVLADDTILQPDLVYIAPPNLSLLVGERLCGAPDLAVEIFNARSAARDRVAKLQAYARFGVPEYWLVDLEGRIVTMLGLDAGQYTAIASGTGRTPLASRVLAGLRVAPADVFEGI